MRMRVQVRGLRQAQQVIEKYSEEKQNAVRDVVAESALNIQREARKRAPVDTGNLRSKIQISIENGGYEAEIGARTKYAAYVEFGTKPHFPPPDKLQGWAKRHGMDGMEFVIARKIARKGTPAQPFLFPAYEMERPKFEARLKAVMKE